jgi:hypothetical protein
MWNTEWVYKKSFRRWRYRWKKKTKFLGDRFHPWLKIHRSKFIKRFFKYFFFNRLKFYKFKALPFKIGLTNSRLSTNYFLKVLGEQVALKYLKKIKFFQWKRDHEFISPKTLLLLNYVI